MSREEVRLKLPKMGALVTLSVRRFRVRMASGFPYADLFWQVLRNVRHGPSPG